MPKSLAEKIGLLLRDTDRMAFHDRILAVERFVHQELEFVSAERSLTSSDLAKIQSDARRIARDMPGDFTVSGEPIHQNLEAFRTICAVEAFYLWMRSQKMTPYHLTIPKT